MENPRIEGELCLPDTWSHGTQPRNLVMLCTVFFSAVDTVGYRMDQPFTQAQYLDIFYNTNNRNTI